MPTNTGLEQKGILQYNRDQVSDRKVVDLKDNYLLLKGLLQFE